MASKLIIADFFGKGRPHKEDVVSATLGREEIRRLEIAVTLEMNKNTHKFFELAINGTEIETMKLEYSTVDKKVVKTYLTYEFSNSIVSSYQISGSHSGRGEPTVSLTFNFRKVKFVTR